MVGKKLKKIIVSPSVALKADFHSVIIKVKTEKQNTTGFVSITPHRGTNVFAEVVVAMVIKVINSAHDCGEERGVMCSCDCTFTKVLLVEQIMV